MRQRLLAFRADLSSERCSSKVLVNGYPAETTGGVYPIDSSAPITPWLVQGSNEVAFKVDPDPRSKSDAPIRVKVEVTIHELGRRAETRQVLTTLAYDSNIPDPIEQSSPAGERLGTRAGPTNITPTSDGGLLISRRLDLPHNFPRWAWLDSDHISDGLEVRASLRAAYENLRQRIEDRDSVALVGLLRERTEELRVALHATQEALPADYGVAQLNSSGAGLTYAIDWEHARFEIYGSGRLAEFTRWDGRPLIVVDLPTGAQYFPFIFRHSQGKWIVTR